MDIAFEWVMEATFQTEPQVHSCGPEAAGAFWALPGARPEAQAAGRVGAGCPRGLLLQKGVYHVSRDVGLRGRRWTSARGFGIKDTSSKYHLPPYGLRLGGGGVKALLVVFGGSGGTEALGRRVETAGTNQPGGIRVEARDGEESGLGPRFLAP